MKVCILRDLQSLMVCTLMVVMQKSATRKHLMVERMLREKIKQNLFNGDYSFKDLLPKTQKHQ